MLSGAKGYKTVFIGRTVIKTAYDISFHAVIRVIPVSGAGAVKSDRYMMFYGAGIELPFDSRLEIRVRPYFILRIGHIAAHEIPFFVKLQGRAGIVLIPAPAVDAPVHEPAPVTIEFFS